MRPSPDGPRGAIASRTPARPPSRPVSLPLVMLVSMLVLAAAWTTTPAAAYAPAAAGPAASLLAAPRTEAAPGISTVRGDLRRSLRAGDAGRRTPRSTTPRFRGLGADGWGYPDSCGAEKDATTHRICTFGDPDGDRTVVMLGSSHATMWVPGLDPAARAAGVRLLGLFKFGCSPIVRRTWVDGEPWPECAAWREWAIDQVADLQPDLVVVAGHHYVNIEGRNGQLIPESTRRYDKAFAGGMRTLGRRLLASSPDVVLMGDTLARKPSKWPTRCLEANDMRFGACVSRLDKRTRAMNARDRRAALAVDARFVDPNRLICLDRRCPVVAGGHFVNRDFSHVSRTWSIHVGPSLAGMLRLDG